MSSAEFTPENDVVAKRSANLAKARQVKAEKHAATSSPDVKPDKMAIARSRREKSSKDFANSGALAGQKLMAPQRPGFSRRWVNDQDGRLDIRQDRGYTFVEQGADKAPFEATSDAAGSKISRRVGSRDGQPLMGYLMEQPEEFHKQDQEDKERSNLKAAETVQRGGSIGSQAYVPDGGSQYELE